VALVMVVVLRSGDERAAAPSSRPAASSLGQVLSSHPLSARAAERALEKLYVSMRDDDSASARCGRREPRPVYSFRRCGIRYPGGSTRRVVLLTNAGGDEVLIENPRP
jgi:hypothetical protein